MKLVSDIFITYDSLEKLGLDDKNFLLEIQKIYKKNPEFKSLIYFGSGPRLKELKPDSFDDIFKIFHSGKTICFCDNINHQSYDDLFTFLVEISQGRQSFKVQIQINKFDFSQLSAKTLLLIKYFDILFKLFEGKIEMDLVSNIFIPGFVYPRIRPPRFTRKYNVAALVHLVNPQKIDFDDARKITENLCTGKLTDNVTRTKIGDYYCINWIGNSTLNHICDLQNILTNKEKWFYENGDFQLHCCNEFGDKNEGITVVAKTEHLTLYSSFNGVGFKATVLNSDGSADIELLEQLKQWLNIGQTPDGKFIKRIGLILPNRESCIEIKKIIANYDFFKILYTDDKANLWNPFPEGLWVKV